MTEPPDTRRLPLEGAVNFRDLGGYRTEDQRVIARGRLFRSDMLADLTPSDLVLVRKLGLRTICDLRSTGERHHKPTPDWHDLSPTVHHIGFMPHEGERLLADTRAGRISSAEIEYRVKEIYRRFVLDRTRHYGHLLRLLASRPTPMLIHCTSGRDRTGFAAAVVLMALGCSRDTIMEDYVMSNRYRRDLTFQIGGRVDPQVMATLTSAHPAYLQAAFDTIDSRWGSDSRFLRDGLGLPDCRKGLLRERLCEAHT